MATVVEAKRKLNGCFHASFYSFFTIRLTSSAEVSSELLENRDDSKSEAQSAVGKSLLEGNGFRVVKKIGSGSYSKVKVNFALLCFEKFFLHPRRAFFQLAFSDTHKAMVAIKIVSKYHVPEEFLRKFLYNEIKVVKFLKHENIIKYYQSIESSHRFVCLGRRSQRAFKTSPLPPRRLYVVMQFAENGSILDLIHKERRLTEARACTLFRQIVAGVGYCHQQGVAHRDLKCENILLDENFVVKLIDFGFAKCYRDTPKSPGEETLETALSDLTKSVASQKSSGLKRQKDRELRLCETYCGSYAYASPEILKGIPYDPYLSDVWAMGCVLFAMLFGRLPFDDRDPSKLIRVRNRFTTVSLVEASSTCN